MDAKKTLAKLKGETEKTSFNIYISKQGLKDFKLACGDFSPSKVIEELMREFVEDSRKSKAKPVRPKNKKS